MMNDARVRRALGRTDGRLATVGAAECARAPRGSQGLSRSLAYHRRARLKSRIGEALDEVDRQVQQLRATEG